MAKSKAPQAGLVTRPQVAAAFAITPGTVTRWERDGMPVAKKTTRGRPTLFDLAAVRAWREQVDAAAQHEALSLTDERAKLAQRQREKIELELAVRRGALVPRDQVVREGAAFVKGWTAKLRSLPRRAVQVGAIEAAQVPAVDALVRDILTEISRWQTVADTTQPPRTPRKRAA